MTGSVKKLPASQTKHFCYKKMKLGTKNTRGEGNNYCNIAVCVWQTEEEMGKGYRSFPH
jgi:hypothetical protein